jgi:methylated-DNA-[protein]-cysteine S-methyltransferase
MLELSHIDRPEVGLVIYYTFYESPIQALRLVSDGRSLLAIHMQVEKHAALVRSDWIEDSAIAPFPETKAQLAAYFAGELRQFDLPLNPEGTAFQQSVWAALRGINYGETMTYGALAQRLGLGGAARAVGLANGRNLLSIVVPCHRVIGADGRLTGYAGGVDRKRWLLEHEGIVGKQLY